uniref:phage tail tape measure protein n=1 Tax=Clostridium botulinum TaxID=1491 RepID=UPI0009B3D7E4
KIAEQAQKDGKSYEEVVMHVIDTISTLDNASATSFQEVASSMMRTASSAQMAGVSFETLASYVATVSATTRKSAESIGESFKTIFARFQDIKQNINVDDGVTISNVEKSLDKVGVALRKDKYHFKEFSQVVEELKPKWKEFNDLQKSDIAKSLAGKMCA